MGAPTEVRWVPAVLIHGYGDQVDAGADEDVDEDEDGGVVVDGADVDEVDGIKVVVNKRSAIYLDGATIDWRKMPDEREGFYFENPNAVKQ